MYKHEYNTVQAVICFSDDLDEQARKLRDRELKKTANPGFFRRLARRTRNLFNTMRDSVMEAINLLMGQAQRNVPGGAVLASQNKHVSKMKQDLTGLMGTSFEPLLEAYIGKRATLEMFRGDKKSEYSGLLKDYTSEFVEMVDVNYAGDDGKAGRADIVVPRHSGVVRHASE